MTFKRQGYRNTYKDNIVTDLIWITVPFWCDRKTKNLLKFSGMIPFMYSMYQVVYYIRNVS